MSSFVLVHGAWHGAYCWEKVTLFLVEAGHKVQALDLPGHGADRTPVPEVTLKAYVDRVLRALDDQPEPVMLVGHSMGGVVITQAAEHRPDKIAMLVYVAAFIPQSGQMLLQLAGEDTESLVTAHRTISEDRQTMSIQAESAKDVFYADCSDEDVARAKAQLIPNSLAPLFTPVHTTEGNFGRVPRVYVEALQDRAITPWLQRKMYTATPCQKVISMNTSHSPFFSAPRELADHLISLTR